MRVMKRLQAITIHYKGYFDMIGILQMLFIFMYLYFGAVSMAVADENWIMDKNTGCAVFNPQPAPNESITWKGNCFEGKARGYGILQWYENGRLVETYSGELKDGKLNGRGYFRFRNGNTYDGDWTDGVRNGRGIYSLNNGDRYDGEFKDDFTNGRGVYSWASGGKYNGEFKNGKMNGHGIYTSENGNQYNVEYKDGNRIILCNTLDDLKQNITIETDYKYNSHEFTVPAKYKTEFNKDLFGNVYAETKQVSGEYTGKSLDAVFVTVKFINNCNNRVKFRYEVKVEERKAVTNTANMIIGGIFALALHEASPKLAESYVKENFQDIGYIKQRLFDIEIESGGTEYKVGKIPIMVDLAGNPEVSIMSMLD